MTATKTAAAYSVRRRNRLSKSLAEFAAEAAKPFHSLSLATRAAEKALLGLQTCEQRECAAAGRKLFVKEVFDFFDKLKRRRTRYAAAKH